MSNDLTPRTDALTAESYDISTLLNLARALEVELQQAREERDEAKQSESQQFLAAVRERVRAEAAEASLSALREAPLGRTTQDQEQTERDAARYRALFDTELIFVGKWDTEEAADSGEGPWVMLMPEQVSAAIDRELLLKVKLGGSPIGSVAEGMVLPRYLAWREFAEHQEHCATCAEAVSDCTTGTMLKDAALAFDVK